MWDVIVLGEIPGTQIQVNFEVWLSFILGLFICLLALLAIRSLKTSRLMLTLRISHILQTAAYTQWLATRHHIQT
jgi:hypothetical protein